MLQILTRMASRFLELFSVVMDEKSSIESCMTATSLTSLNVHQMRSGLLNGDFSAVELAEAHFNRIEATNETLNSFITITKEQGLQAAASTDELLKSEGDETPPLTGIPIAIKDMIVTKDVETTCASNILKGFIPPYDATAVAKLRKAGAVIVGKTNLDEFAMGSSNENSAFGPVKNPHDLSCVPGGSSGGSAVAVAAGQAPLSLGTDTGGSIRQPAAFCGIYGLKPTYGRVSRYGSVAFASSLDQIGPFARTLEDLALLQEVISGKDELDATSIDREVPRFSEAVENGKNQDLKGVRVGLPRAFFEKGIHSSIATQLAQTASQLAASGAELVDIELPHADHALAAYYVINPAEASSNLARYDGVRYGARSEAAHSLSELYEKTRAEFFGAEVKRRILIGTYVLSAGYYDAYYRKAQQVRTVIIDDFKAAFRNNCDVILTPTTPTPPFKLGEKISDCLSMYLADIFTVPVSLAGLPALSVPCGADSNNMPIGLQFIAPSFEEARLFRVAAHLGQTTYHRAHLALEKEF